MIALRRSADRGHAQHGWLDSRHSFSFAEYHDAEHMAFGPLRVINEDRVQPGRGFPTHGHRDMEILTYVLEGALEHKDSLGNGSIIAPGDVQRMSAGRGVQHSEYNASKTEVVHFLQIWIEPSDRGIAPGYQQTHVSVQQKRASLCLIAAPEGENGAVLIHQDARVYASMLDGAEALEHALRPARRAYVHVARGAAHVNDVRLATGDAAKVTGEASLRIDRGENAELLLFDLP